MLKFFLIFKEVNMFGVQVNLGQIKEVVTIPEIQLSDAKAQKVAYVIFGTASFFLANTLSGLGSIFCLLSLPFYILTLSYVSRFFNIKDYESPEKLEEYRKAAQEQTFEELLRNHGMQNILKHELVSDPLLAEKLKSHLVGLGPGEIARLDDELTLEVMNHGKEQLFKQAFKEGMKVELKDLKPSKIFNIPGIEFVMATDLVHEDLKASYNQYIEVRQTNRKNREQLIADFKHTLSTIIQPFETALNLAKSQDAKANKWIRSLKQELPVLKRQNNPTTIEQCKFSILENNSGSWSDLSDLHEAQQQLRANYFQASKKLENGLEEQKTQVENMLSTIDDQYD